MGINRFKKLICLASAVSLVVGCKDSTLKEGVDEPIKDYAIVGEVVGESFNPDGKYCLNRLPLHYFTVNSEEGNRKQFLLLEEDAAKSDALITPGYKIKIKMSGNEWKSWDSRYEDAFLIRAKQIKEVYSK